MNLESPPVRKAFKILSIVSCVLLVGSAVYSLVIIIKYNDYPYLMKTTLEQRWMWERFDPKTYSLWQSYWSEYNFDYALTGAALFLFLVSGVPIWRNNFSNPSRLLSKLLSKKEKALLSKLMELLKSLTTLI
jgi:hypothetical protein